MYFDPGKPIINQNEGNIKRTEQSPSLISQDRNTNYTYTDSTISSRNSLSLKGSKLCETTHHHPKVPDLSGVIKTNNKIL